MMEVRCERKNGYFKKMLAFLLVFVMASNLVGMNVSAEQQTEAKVKRVSKTNAKSYEEYETDGEGIELESIFLDVEELELKVGEEYLFDVTCEPDDADVDLTWYSENEDIAYFEDPYEGTLTAIGSGTTTIYVEDYASGLSASCDVTVKAVIEDISLDVEELELEIGDEYLFDVTYEPDDVDVDLVWYSDDEDIAYFEDPAKGILTAVGSGTTTIYVEDLLSGMMASCDVTVKAVPKKVELDVKEMTLQQGKNFTLCATISPSNVSNRKLTWSTSDRTVAVVDNKGKVTAKGMGIADITVKTYNGKKAQCRVTVAGVKLNVTSLELNKGKTAKIKVKQVYPKTDKVVSYTSKNKNVATVNRNGKVTAKAVGTTTIVVKMRSGTTQTCQVTVSGIDLSQEKVKLQKGKSLKLNAVVYGKQKKVTWISSNTKIATVSKTGKIKAKKAGKVRITAKTASGDKKVCWVIVTDVVLNKQNIVLKKGASGNFIKVKNAYPKTDKVAYYQSSNEKIVRVNRKGRITAKSVGTAKITVVMRSGATASCMVKVKKK